MDIDVGYIRGGLLGGKYTDNTFIIRNGLMRKAENPKKLEDSLPKSKKLSE